MEAADLGLIAARLEGLEETIIGRLIDRAQFRLNRNAYTAGMSGFEGEAERNLLDIRLSYQEHMDGLFGRFEVPEERPFSSGLPPPARTVTLPPSGLRIRDFDAVNVTARILSGYLDFLPSLCPAGDDGQYGSSTEHDVYALQAISRRIHYGAMYVAESKYLEKPAGYRKLILAGDTKAIETLLTRPEVEERIIVRIREKTARLQDGVNRAVRSLIDPETVASFYRTVVIPLTKHGEVLYLLGREE